LAKRPAIAPSDVFINVPFDPQHEKLFLALFAGLVGLGLNPRSVLEVPPGSLEHCRKPAEPRKPIRAAWRALCYLQPSR